MPDWIAGHLDLEVIDRMRKSSCQPVFNRSFDHNSPQRKANELCKTRHPRSPPDLQGGCLKKNYSPTARGVLLTDLSRIARAQGFETRIRTGTLDDLSAAVKSRRPPIVLLDLGLGSYNIPHFTAITGVVDSGVFLLGPEPEADYLSTSHFERQWKKAGNQYLVLLPPPASSL